MKSAQAPRSAHIDDALLGDNVIIVLCKLIVAVTLFVGAILVLYGKIENQEWVCDNFSNRDVAFILVLTTLVLLTLLTAVVIVPPVLIIASLVQSVRTPLRRMWLRYYPMTDLFMFYLFFSMGSILILWNMKLWSPVVLGTTVVFFFVTGLPIIFDSIEEWRDGNVLTKRVVKMFGFSFAFSYYASLVNFSFWVELVVVIVVLTGFSMQQYRLSSVLSSSLGAKTKINKVGEVMEWCPLFVIYLFGMSNLWMSMGNPNVPYLTQLFLGPAVLGLIAVGLIYFSSSAIEYRDLHRTLSDKGLTFRLAALSTMGCATVLGKQAHIIYAFTDAIARSQDALGGWVDARQRAKDFLVGYSK